MLTLGNFRKRRIIGSTLSFECYRHFSTSAEIAFVCVFGAGMLGLTTRASLPDRHLSEDSTGDVIADDVRDPDEIPLVGGLAAVGQR
jgi:hypothetical protein